MRSFLQKSVLVVALFTFFQNTLYSSAPLLKEGYFHIGLDAGYGQGKEKGGLTFGLVHTTAVFGMMVVETSTSKFSMFNEESTTTNVLLQDLLTIDLGFGGRITDNLFLAAVPFSLNLTQVPGFGLGLMAKYNINNYIIEGKILPVRYNKNEVKMLNDNSYLGVRWFVNRSFSLGVKYNRYDKYGITSLLVGFAVM